MRRTRRHRWRLSLALWLGLLLCACAPLIPATTPPHLARPPGPWVSIGDGRFRGGGFMLEYPRHWRVVHHGSAGAAPMAVSFVAPAGGSITLARLDAGADTSDQRLIQLADGSLLRAAVEMAAADGDFPAQVERLIASIRVSVRASD